jgi:myosin-5
MMSQYRNACQLDLPAHIFAMANKAYHGMIHEAKNQRFIISGESGAGKTVTANLVIFFNGAVQGTPTEGEGLVQLTISLEYLVF